jgi:hypothetical protein
MQIPPPNFFVNDIHPLLAKLDLRQRARRDTAQIDLMDIELGFPKSA